MTPHKRLAAKHIAEAIDSLSTAKYLLASPPYCREYDAAREIRELRESLIRIRDKLIEPKEESA